MSSILRAYQKFVSKYNVLANTIQTGVLMGSGDVIAQTIIEKRKFKQYEAKRTLQFAMIGSCFVGPALTVWYRILRRQFGATGLTTTVKKVACDQLMFAPAFIAFLITSLNVIQGKSIDHLREDMRTKYFDIVLMNWRIWPAVQMCNFYLTPFQYQVLVVQVVSLFWNAYLSWKTQKEISVATNAEAILQ